MRYEQVLNETWRRKKPSLDSQKHRGIVLAQAQREGEKKRKKEEWAEVLCQTGSTTMTTDLTYKNIHNWYIRNYGFWIKILWKREVNHLVWLRSKPMFSLHRESMPFMPFETGEIKKNCLSEARYFCTLTPSWTRTWWGCLALSSWPCASCLHTAHCSAWDQWSLEGFPMTPLVCQRQPPRLWQ